MKHGIAHGDWIDYLEGSLNPVDRQRISLHLLSCESCLRLYKDLSLARNLLIPEAAGVRESVVRSDMEIEALEASVIDRLRDCSTAAVAERLQFLRVLLAPLYGAGAVDRSIHVAARRAANREPSQMTIKQWDAFVANVQSAAGTICGLSAAQLIRRVTAIWMEREVA